MGPRWEPPNPGSWDMAMESPEGGQEVTVSARRHQCPGGLLADEDGRWPGWEQTPRTQYRTWESGGRQCTDRYGEPR